MVKLGNHDSLRAELLPEESLFQKMPQASRRVDSNSNKISYEELEDKCRKLEGDLAKKTRGFQGAQDCVTTACLETEKVNEKQDEVLKKLKEDLHTQHQMVLNDLKAKRKREVDDLKKSIDALKSHWPKMTRSARRNMPRYAPIRESKRTFYS